MKKLCKLLTQRLSLLSKSESNLKKSVAFMIILVLSVSAFAQQTRLISGVVLDENGDPVVGATVIVKGTTTGSITDIDGNYAFNVPQNATTLEVSFIGMQTQEITLTSESYYKIELTSDTELLDDVIIVGYGQQKKESVVGAITQTTGEVLQRAGGVTNVGAALTGQLPGVITYSSSGQPGEEDPQIIIRAQTSWNNSSPLILVDGIERAMSDVDISSVENISVLKDASATAVYGVRGANGVILITTKRGKEGKANIQVRANATMKVPSKLPQKFDSFDALMVRNLAIEREMGLMPGLWDDYTPRGVINKYRYPASVEEFERYPNVNWEDELFKDYAMAYNASANVSGGTKLVKYFAAIDFLNEGDLFKTVENGHGYEPGFNYNRINVRSNLDFQLTKTTTFRSNLFGSNGTKQTPWNFSGSWPWAAAYYTAPDAMRPMYSNGIWGYFAPHDAAQPNSVYEIARNGIEKESLTKITTDFSLKQELDFIVKGLAFEATYSNDNSFLEVERGVEDRSFRTSQRMWVNPNTGVVVFEQPVNASTQFDYVDQVNWQTQAGHVQTGSTYRRQYYSARLNYNGTFGDHNVTALGLLSREQESRGNVFPRYREDWVFRTTYNYAGKYLFEMNGAYNGSEMFGPGYRFAFFPSLSVGWMLSEERFMESLTFMDMFKIRGSWGKIGDDGINARFLYSDQWNYQGRAYLGRVPSNQSPYVFFTNTQVGNPDISWETVEKRNIGIDYAFLDGLIAGSFDYFNDYRTDILLQGNQRAVPSYFGGQPSAGNLGEVKAKGYELEVRLSKRITPSLRLWSNINMTHAVNEVKFADDPVLLPGYQKSAGYAIGQTRSYIDAGYLSSWDDVLGSTQRQVNDNAKIAGDYNIIDFNGDGIIDTYDRAPYQYSGVPQNTYSATFGLDWKGLNASAQFYGVSNVSREVRFPTFYESKNNVYTEGTYWTVDGGGDVPMPRWGAVTGPDANGTRYWYDGSYLRLKTAELGYTFNSGWTNSIGIRSCKFYVSGNNLFLWTDMPDDRESNFSGDSRSGAYPTMSRYTFGIDITF